MTSGDMYLAQGWHDIRVVATTYNDSTLKATLEVKKPGADFAVAVAEDLGY